jgi:hypothetical protein
MKTSAVISAVSVTFCALLLTPEALAVPILSFDPQQNDSYEGSAPGATRGWEFDVVSPGGITITDLGIFDFGADGLADSHTVGIWNSSGNLLVSATVPAGTVAPLDANGLFRSVAIPDLWLPQAAGYRIGAWYNVGGIDAFEGGVANLNVDPAISFVRNLTATNVPVLTFPAQSFSYRNPGYFGPGFEIVPEPSTRVLTGAAVALSIWPRKRLRKLTR